MEAEYELREEDVLATARACMDAREFQRAVHLLRDCKSARARFLSVYNQFMVRLAEMFSLRTNGLTWKPEGQRKEGVGRLE
jgi:hypothetical protein